MTPSPRTNSISIVLFDLRAHEDEGRALVFIVHVRHVCHFISWRWRRTF